jgi:(E)-4-hydroxy-3-methyl-but-2-enyl pyrophosphate reductase
MIIEVAKTRGFCYGVKKAVNLAQRAPSERKKPVYTLGPLIHNRHVIESLREAGVNAVDSHERISSGTVIVRTHGLPKKTLNLLRGRDLNIIDATCPFVKKIQTLVESLSRDGYYLVLVGERSHPEVEALISYAKGPIAVINSAAEIRGLSRNGRRIAVLSQSTQTLEKFDKITRGIKNRFHNAKILNTICRASSQRQKEAEKLAERVDVMLVIGGRDSANTRHTASLCSKHAPTHHIESEDEIRKSWFAGAGSVGITAGASTPELTIKQIIKKVRKEG